MFPYGETLLRRNLLFLGVHYSIDQRRARIGRIRESHFNIGRAPTTLAYPFPAKRVFDEFVGRRLDG